MNFRQSWRSWSTAQKSSAQNRTCTRSGALCTMHKKSWIYNFKSKSKWELSLDTGEDSNIVPFRSPMVAPVPPYGTHLKSLKHINAVIASACQLHCQLHLMIMTSAPPLSTAIANGINIPYRYTDTKDAHTSLYKAHIRKTSSQGCTHQQQHSSHPCICVGTNIFDMLRLT